MSDLKKAERDPEALLWEEMKDVHAAMLGYIGSDQHLQPMAFTADREARSLWFFTKRDTDLFQALRPGAEAQLIVISKKQDFHASVRGTLSEHDDRAKVDELWNPVTAGWFDGKDDPALVLLRLAPRHAAVWASTGSGLAFAWEIAKANVTDQMPDVGVRTEVTFA